MERAIPSLSVRSKVWFVVDELHAFGTGLAHLLDNIEQLGTLSQAARRTGMSYRYAWGLIKKAEAKLGEPLIEASKGGRLGGGSSVITELGTSFIEDFERIQEQWRAFISSEKTIVEGEITEISETNGGFSITITSSQSGLSEGDRVKVSLF